MMLKQRIATVAAVMVVALWSAGPVFGTEAAAAAHGGEPAHAAQQEAGHGERPTLFTGDLGNIFWSLLTFLLVVFVLGRYAWGPLLTALRKREAFIRDSLAQAKADREAAEARLREYEERVRSARAEATAIVEEGRRDAEAVKRKIEEEARAESEAMIDRAKREIDLATDSAVKSLYTLAADLATEVAGRIIEKELSASDHGRLVADSIAELSRRSNGKG